MEKSKTTIQVIDRSVSLLEAIANCSGPSSLKILSAETELHPSTAFRILSSLIENGFVERDNLGHYFIGRKISKLANSAPRGISLRKEAANIMKQLRNEIGESINLTVREGDEIVYIERAIPDRMMRVQQVIGSRAPLHVTAVGKLMLDVLGEEFIQAYSKRSGLKAYTEHTLSTLDELKTAIHESTAQGFAYDNEEAEIGVGCIGVLLHNSLGDVIGGLSISAPIERRKDEWIVLLQQAATQISERM